MDRRRPHPDRPAAGSDADGSCLQPETSPRGNGDVGVHVAVALEEVDPRTCQPDVVVLQALVPGLDDLNDVEVADPAGVAGADGSHDVVTRRLLVDDLDLDRPGVLDPRRAAGGGAHRALGHGLGGRGRDDEPEHEPEHGHEGHLVADARGARLEAVGHGGTPPGVCEISRSAPNLGTQ